MQSSEGEGACEMRDVLAAPVWKSAVRVDAIPADARYLTTDVHGWVYYLDRNRIVCRWGGAG